MNTNSSLLDYNGTRCILLQRRMPRKDAKGNNAQVSTKEWVAVEKFTQLGRAVVAQALVA
jgi:hypothetical protein